MTKLTDPQARALFGFVFAQVQHLLPDPLPRTGAQCMQLLREADQEKDFAAYKALVAASMCLDTGLPGELLRLSLHAKEAAFQARECLYWSAFLEVQSLTEPGHHGAKAGNRKRRQAMQAQREFIAAIGGAL